MILRTHRALARKLRLDYVKYFPSPVAIPLLPSPYPRSYTTFNDTVGHISTANPRQDSSSQSHGAADSFPAGTDIQASNEVDCDSTDPQSAVQELNSVIEQRFRRLPRSRLSDESPLERNLKDAITWTPCFKTARQDVDRAVQDVKKDNAARHAPWKRRNRSDSVNWLPVVRRLVPTEEPPPIPLPTATLELDSRFVDYYVGTCSYNMWILHVGSGAEIKLPPYPPSRSSRVKVFIHGSFGAADLAVKTLKQEQAFYLSSRRLKLENPLDPSPESIRSVASFTSYVTYLRSSNLPRQIQQSLGEPNQIRIGKALLHVFLDPIRSKFANTLALERAMSYICEHQDLESVGDALYARAKQLGLRPSISTLNSLIKLAIRLGRVSKTMFLIDDMRRMGLKPTGHTWILFLATGSINDSKSISDRLVVLDVMREAQVVLDSESRRELVHWMIHQDFNRVTDTEEAFSELLKHFDDVFGHTWLDEKAYRSVVQAVLAPWNPKKILPDLLLDLPAERGLKTTRNIEILKLYLHRHRRNVSDSINVLREMLRRDDGKQLQMPIAFAFMTAWERQSANVCRVLWRYAASRGYILHKMQKAVNESLLRNSSTKEWVTTWHRVAGSIIAGIDINTNGFQEAFPRLSRFCSQFNNPMNWLNQYTPDDGTRDEQISLAYVIMNRELNAWKHYQPMNNKAVALLLETAHKMDEDWVENSLLENLPTPELIERAITVPLTPKDSEDVSDRLRSMTVTTVGNEVEIKTSSVDSNGSGNQDDAVASDNDKDSVATSNA